MASFSPSKYSSGSSLKPTFGSISYNNIYKQIIKVTLEEIQIFISTIVKTPKQKK
jgi:hypothetical protein